MIIIDRVRQGAISCEERSEGPDINQVNSDEDLPSPVINQHLTAHSAVHNFTWYMVTNSIDISNYIV